MIETQDEALELGRYFRIMIDKLDDPYLKAHMLSRLLALFEHNPFPNDIKAFARETALNLRIPLQQLIFQKKQQYYQLLQYPQKAY
ncbi:MAG: hypothetical protein ABIH34_06435 [Nanoarchaeota archaeon]